MTLPRREFLHLAAGAATLPAVSRFAWAQAFPRRPITFIVAFAAGGPQDVVARILAEKMRNVLGQPVIVENVAGAGGTIGVGRVARAASDGYTICSRSMSTHVYNGALFPLQYDLLRDFEPVSLTVGYSLVIVATNRVPANNLQEMIGWLKAIPGKASAGNAGAGTPSHLAGIAFQKETGTQFQSVPYRGNNPAMQDLLSGQIDLMLTDPIVALPHVRAGAVKAFAITGKARAASAPEIPTAHEAGVPNFYHTNWVGVFAPKGTSKEVISILNSAISTALGDTSVRSRLADLGQDIFAPEERSPQVLRNMQKADIDKWWPIIKATNIKAE